MYRYLLVFIMFLAISLQVYSQATEVDVRVAYIYRLPNYIDWQKDFKKFTIGCYTKNKLEYEKLKYIADTRKIKDKKVEVKYIASLDELKNLNLDLLYYDGGIDEDIIKEDIENILLAINEKKTLLITNNEEEKQSIMINFLTSEKEGLVRFEVNKKNIVEEGLIVSPDILLLGGSFVDVRELFQKKDSLLSVVEEKLNQSIIQIEKKQKLIDSQDNEINKKNELIAKRNLEIEQQYKKLSYQKYFLDSLIGEVAEKQEEIQKSNKAISSQLNLISDHKKQLKDHKLEIDKSKNLLDKQNTKLNNQSKEIESQKSILIDQLTRIRLQQNLIAGGVIIVLLILSLVYFIYRGLRIKKRANSKLKQYNEEILVQNEEIKSQREEIESARDQLSDINKQLENRNKELDKYRMHLEDKVKQRTADLLIEKEKAEEASKMKTAFIENMSHEIRTPMNAILGFTRLITTLDTSKEVQDEYVKIVNTNAEALMRFINDLIDISNIESGKLYISKSEEDVNELLNELYYVYLERIKEAGKYNEVRIEKKVSSGKLMMNTDHHRVKQVFENLLSNAVKYTDSGYIEYGYEQLADSVRFYVKDTGIGIPQDKHQFVFERFNRIENDKTKVYRGVGIGLSICQSIANALDGKIELQSEPDVGSEFSFVIPNEKAV
jgi:signal transduction histidine kinase